MFSSDWDPQLLVDLHGVAFRALRKLGVAAADAEFAADRIQEGIARQAREKILDPLAYVNRAAQFAAQRSAQQRTSAALDLETISSTAPESEEDEEERRDAEARENLGRDLAQWLAAAPEQLDYMPDALEDYLSALAERWLEERDMGIASQQNIAWVLAALVRGDERTVAKMADIAKRSGFPRERFLEMTRETDKPPLARSEEELARLMLDAVVNRTASSTVSAARQLVEVARLAWPPLRKRDYSALEQSAREVIAIATPDRRVRGERNRKISEGRSIVRTLLKSWGFEGTHNYLKRL